MDLLQQLGSALHRVQDRTHSDEDVRLLQEALLGERLAVASGDRAVALGHGAEDTVIVTGDGNVVCVFRDSEAAGPLNAVLEAVRTSGTEKPEQLDLSSYRERVRSRLADWTDQYVPLDADPMVWVTGPDLQAEPEACLPLTQALRQHERLVILGRAGAGKTSSLLYLARLFAEDGVGAGEPLGLTAELCIYVELGRFRRSTDRSPLDDLLALLADTLYAWGAFPEPPSLRTVRALLDAGRLLVLLDGLNEARSGVQDECLQGIQDLAHRYPANRYILTRRPYGFLPPEGWGTVSLREFDDGQALAFLRLRTGDPTQAQTLLRTVVASRNPLLRLPLFLDFLVRTRDEKTPAFQRRLRSRSGIVACYIEHLLHHDAARSGPRKSAFPPERLEEALRCLADAVQKGGQSLPWEDAEGALGGACLAAADRGGPGELLQTLCALGFLVSDGRRIRFWHHTLQEHYYSAHVVSRWRGANRALRDVPRWLRPLLHDPYQEEALAHVIAHLRDEEVAPALSAVARESPMLAMAWADDLRLEGRAPEAVSGLIQAMARRIRLGVAFSRLGDERAKALLRLLLVGTLGWVLAPLVGALVQGVWDSTWDRTTTFDLVLVFSIGGYVVSLAALLLVFPACHGAGLELMEGILGSAVGLTDPRLRLEIASMAQGCARRWWASSGVSAMLLSLSQIGGEASVPALLEAGSARYRVIRMLGYTRGTSVLPVLQAILEYRNAYSRAALCALMIRASRVPSERDSIRSLAQSVWQDTRADWSLRALARQTLVRLGQHPDAVRSLVWPRVWADLLGVLLGVGWWFVFRLGASLIGRDYDIGTSLLLAPSSVLPLGIWWLGTAACVWGDARRLGASRIRGCPGYDSHGYWTYALGCLVCAPIALPVYVVNRGRIRRNGQAADWKAIAESVVEEGPSRESSAAKPSV